MGIESNSNESQEEVVIEHGRDYHLKEARKIFDFCALTKEDGWADAPEAIMLNHIIKHLEYEKKEREGVSLFVNSKTVSE